MAALGQDSLIVVINTLLASFGCVSSFSAMSSVLSSADSSDKCSAAGPSGDAAAASVDAAATSVDADDDGVNTIMEMFKMGTSIGTRRRSAYTPPVAVYHWVCLSP